jgi:uncharacterized protein (TIGR02246 family)
MRVDPQEHKVVEDLFRAMQAGPAGEEAMMSLFTDDAVFTENFSGQPLTHEGKDAIRQAFRALTQQEGPPDIQLNLERVDRVGPDIRADWNCTSSVFPAPMRGHDLFRVTGGRITRLDVVVTDMPPIGP